jgi:hypothetical protein
MSGPQFRRRTHRAREQLSAAGREYPDAWVQADEFRAGRGVDLPTWPDWCYLPLAAAYAIVSGGGENQVSAARAGDIARIGALAAWRMTQGIYRFDPALYEALIDTPVTGDLPAEILTHAPEWCIYIETPDRSFAGERLYGAWCHLEHDVESGRMELRLLLDVESGTVPMPIHVAGGLGAGLDAMAVEAQRHAAKHPLGALLANTTLDMSPVRSSVEPIVSLFLYLCSESADLTRRGQPAVPANPVPTRTRRDGWRLFAADGPREWDVGVRVGAALRDAYQREQTGGEAAAPGHSVRPHVRRAHWHTILSGPRKDVAPADQTRELRWMPPIPINVTDYNTMPTVIRPVPGASTHENP